MLCAEISIGECTNLHVIRKSTSRDRSYTTRHLDLMLYFMLKQLTISFFKQNNAIHIELVLWRTYLKLKQYIIWNTQHALITWIQSSKFGTHSDDLLQRDWGFLYCPVLWCNYWGVGTYSSENLFIMSSNP